MFIQLKEVFYTATTILLKISLGLFFLRILTKRWQNRTFRIIIAVSVVYGLFFFFIILFQCGDPKHLADRLLTKHKCLPVGVVLGTGYGYGTINVIADWTFVLIPIAILLDSDLDRRSKISVSIVMAFGAVGSVASIFRMVFLRGTLIGHGSLSSKYLHPRLSHMILSIEPVLTHRIAVAVKVQIWTTAEPGMGIIASSIAILRPLLRKLSLDLQTTVSKSRRGSETAVDNKTATKPHTRKISLPMHKKDVQPDQIALTARSPVVEAHSAIRSPRSVDPWSPTAAESHAFPQRVTSVGMFNYKEGFGPSRV